MRRQRLTFQVDDEPTVRAQFRDIYNNLLRAQKRDALYVGLPSAGLRSLERKPHRIGDALKRALPPGEGRLMGMGHSTAVVNRARELAEAGWNAADIARQIPDEFRGCAPAETTVRRWIDPDYAERQRIREQVGGPKMRRWGWRRRLDRARDLRGAGLTYSAVAAVMRLDFGLDLSERQVESLVNEKVSEQGARAALGCPAPTGAEA